MARKRRCSGKLYATLGVQDTATSTEIKKAYHKQALLHHPDKAGPGHEAEFKVIQNAYSTLSDAEKREMYDNMGSKGMAQYGNVPGASVVAVHPAIVILYPLIWLIIMTMLLASLALLVKKVDNDDSGTYGGTVFVPIWILSAVLCIFGLRLLAIVPDVWKKKEPKDGEEEEKPMRRFQAVGFILLINIVIALAVASAAMMSQYLDGNLAEIGTAFIPIFILFGMSVVAGILSMDYNSFVRRVAMENGVDPDQIVYSEIKGQYIASCVAQVINLICQCAFVALVYINVAHPASEGRNWFVVFVPLFIRVGLPVLVGICMVIPATTSDAKTKIFAIVSMLLISGLVILTLVLLAWKCEKARQGLPHEGPTLGQVCIIPFIVMSLSILGSLFMFSAALHHTCCGDGAFPGDEDYDEAEQGGAQPTASAGGPMGYQERSSSPEAQTVHVPQPPRPGSAGNGTGYQEPDGGSSGYQKL